MVKKKLRDAKAHIQELLDSAACAPPGKSPAHLLVALIQALSVEHTRIVGGYPDDVRLVMKPSIVIAGFHGDASNAEPKLTVLPLRIAFAKFKKGCRLLETDSDFESTEDTFGEVGFFDEGGC